MQFLRTRDLTKSYLDHAFSNLRSVFKRENKPASRILNTSLDKICLHTELNFLRLNTYYHGNLTWMFLIFQFNVVAETGGGDRGRGGDWWRGPGTRW